MKDQKTGSYTVDCKLVQIPGLNKIDQKHYQSYMVDCSCNKIVADRNMPWLGIVDLVVAVAAAEGCFAKRPKTFPGTAEDPRLEMSCY